MRGISMKLLHRKTYIKAFTIVELAIVITVIGIIASITIVSFSGYQNRARTAAAIEGANQATDLLEAFQLKNNGLYPATGSLSSAGVTDTTSVTYQYSQTSSGANYCLTATSKDVSYKISQDAKPVAGSCPGHGANGVPAITNLVTNPSFEANTTSWVGLNTSVARSTTWSTSGAASLLVTPVAASADTSARYGSSSTLLPEFSVGSTYTVSGTIYLPVAQTGTIDGRARGITVYSWNGATPALAGQSSLAPNSAGSTRITVSFIIPAGATALEIRFYNGANNTASNIVYWDAVSITSGSTTRNYADGNSANWVWNGTVNNSTSTGPPL